MKLKKLAAAFMVGAFAFSIVPVVSSPVAFAAKGGAKLSAPKSAPSTTKSAAPSTNSTTKAASPNTKDYAPSKSAKDLGKDAPAAKANAAAAATKSSTPWGSIMRNVGLFAGGMMLGGLLSSLFGMGGTGFMSETLGLLMNLIMLGVVVMVIRMLWNKFRSRKQENQYASSMQDRPIRDTINVTPHASETKTERHALDVQPPQDAGYDARHTADRYRNR